MKNAPAGKKKIRAISRRTQGDGLPTRITFLVLTKQKKFVKSGKGARGGFNAHFLKKKEKQRNSGTKEAMSSVWRKKGEGIKKKAED